MGTDLLYHTQMSYYRRIFLSLIVPVLFLASPAFAGGSGVLAQENGLLENIQIALLLLSGFICVMQSFSIDRNFRFIPWMGAWLSPSFILRELDVERLSVPQWVVWMSSGMGRNLILGMGWIILCVLAIKSYPELKGRFGEIARSRTAILMFAAGIVLCLGALFDHGVVSNGQSKL